MKKEFVRMCIFVFLAIMLISGCNVGHHSPPMETYKTVSENMQRISPSSDVIFDERFTSVVEGDIPAKWTADPGVGVKKFSGKSALANLTDGKHAVSIPIEMPSENFRIGYEVMASGGFSIKIGNTVFEKQFSSWEVEGPSGEASTRDLYFQSDNINVVEIEKKGSVYVLYVNGAKLLVTRGNADSGRIIMFVSYSNFNIYRVYAIKIL